MHFERYAGRSLKVALASRAGLLGIGLCLLATPVTANQTLMWRGAERVAVLCLVNWTPRLDHRALEAALCSRVANQAAQGSPLPVSVIVIGDPQVIAADTVTLLVHASVESGSDARPLMAFAARPFRATADQSAQLFSAAPRAIVLGSEGTLGAEVDGAIASALDEILPWRAKAPTTTGRPL